jgi:hypothetical protein
VIGSLLGVIVFAHGLPPYRPLSARLQHAEAVGLVRITEHRRHGVALQPMRSLRGRVPARANFMPGHRLPRSARHGLATFRRVRGQWIIQEQNREWVELPPQADGGTALVAWVKVYQKSTADGLRLGIRSPLLRTLATRDLVFRLQAERSPEWVMLAVALLLDPAIDDPASRRSIERAALAGRTPSFRRDFSACVAGRDIFAKPCTSLRSRFSLPAKAKAR